MKFFRYFLSVQIFGFFAIGGALAKGEESKSSVRVRVLRAVNEIELKAKRWTSVPLGMERHLSPLDIGRVPPKSALLLEGVSLKVNGLPLAKRVWIHRLTSQKQVDVVAEFNLDHYVFGVLIAEMPHSWPLEALKAQAVAIRSYTQSLMRERGHQHYDLDNTVMDQVFEGNPEVQLKDVKYKNALRAVFESREIILIDPKKKHVAKAHFHSDCGGQTVDPAWIWGKSAVKADSFSLAKNSKMVVATDPSCAQRKSNRWQARISKAELPAEIKDRLVTQVSANVFRQMFGFDQIRSTFFKFIESGESWSVNGKGYGHGAGLCQWGSRDWAQSGWNFRRILEHYYPYFELTDAKKSGSLLTQNAAQPKTGYSIRR